MLFRSNKYPNGNFSNYSGPSTNYDLTKIQNLIKSGIGEGYYMVKAGGKGGAEFFKIDSDYTDTASNVSAPQVFYGGDSGKGKRIDIIFESPTYYFKVNIRNKQGGLYPSHIMCDYKKK